MSMKNSNNNNGNQTCDLPTYSAVPQPTAPPRTSRERVEVDFNPLSPELNPICYLLALLA
jgi:hypothetical protein